MVDALGRLMRDKRLLLVLDNFEHLLEAAPAASRLLAAAPGLRILATSRAPLRLTGERVYDLPPLRVPDLRRLPPVADLRRYSAIDLFVRRARDAKSAFALTPANAPAVAEICQRLDGLPLAIELAAVRVRAFTPQTMLTHLDHHTGASLRFLTAAPRNLPPHQKTLRRAIDWSCQLLAPGDQRLLRRLGVFVGGWTLLAAQTVCGQGTEGESSDAQTARSAVADSLARLVEHNLAQEAEGPQGESRYSLLETIREYALEQLEAAGEAQDLRARFVRHYAHMAQAVEPLLTEHRSINPLNLPAYRQLKPDYANLLQALAWCEPAFPEPLARLRFLLSLAWFWIIQAHLTGQPGDLESLERRIIETRERCAAIPDDLLAVVLHRLSWLAGAQGDLPRAIERGAAFLAHSRAHGTTAQVMHALYAHGVSLCLAGRLDDGQPSLEEQERLAREADSPYDLAAAVGMLGRIALGRGDPARAEVLLAEALDVARRHGYDWTPSASGSVCASQRDLGLARIRRDDIAGGMAVLEEARDFALRNQLTLFTASCEVYLAYGDLRLGRAASACQRLRFSLHLFQQANYEDRACGVLALHAQALSRLGRLDSAMTIAGAAASKEAVIQNASPSEMLLREDCLRALDEARGHLGDPRLASAWAAGMAMTLDQAVALAQSDA
jgi:predicted ATPase